MSAIPSLWSPIAAAAMVMLVMILASPVDAQAIKYVNGGSYSSMLTFGTGVSIVKVRNAVFTGGSAGIAFNIGQMMSSRQPVVIEICGATLRSGAIIYFLGGSSITGMKPAYITVTDVSAKEGGIGFGAGSYPLYSRLILRKLAFTIDSSTATFSLLSSYCPCTPTCLLFGGLTLQKTVLRITDSTINGALRNGLFPVRFNSFTVSDYSLWMMDNTYLGNSFAFHGHSPVITDNSVFIISKVNAVCDRFCVSFEGGVTVSANSAFIFESSSASADGHDLLFISGPLTVSSGSLFMAIGNYFITPRWAFSISSGATASGTNSLISFVDNNLLGLPWHMTCSGNCQAQCNALGQAQLSTVAQYVTAGLRTPSNAFGCDVRTNCPKPTVGCFQPLTDLTIQGTSVTGCCVCKPGGYGKYCLPVEIPYVPEMCAETETLAKFTETKTMTQSEEASATLSGKFRNNVIVVSKSITLTLTQRLTHTHNPTHSKSFPLTRSEELASRTHRITPTRTLRITDTESESRTATVSGTPTLSITPLESTSATVTFSATVTTSLKVSPTDDTLSLSKSQTVTLTSTQSKSANVTVTKSESLTSSLGHCIWDRSGLAMPRTYKYMQVTPYFPLAMTQVTFGFNYTMAIPYADAFSGYRFNLSSLGQWKVDAASVKGEATFVLFENATTTDSALISVGPPTSRYTNILLRSAFVAVTFRCATTYYTETFAVVILPEEPVVQEGVVNDVLASALASGIIIASPPVAAAAAWAMIFQQLMLCKNIAENSAISFTGLTIGDDGLRFLRGAIVANFLIVIAQAVIVMIIGGVVVLAAKARDPKQRFMRALSVLQWPHVMHISIGALLLLNMTASVSLLAANGTAEDYVLGMVGAGGCTLYTVQMCLSLYFAHRATANAGNNRQWQVAQSLGSDHFVFGNYKRPWFAGYETANNLFIGLIAGLPPGGDMCVLQMWAIFLASLIIICLIAYYRPMKTLLSLVFVGAIQLLTFMAANAMLVAHYVPAQRSSAFSAATVVLLVIPLVALLKALTDIVAFVMHGRTLFQRLMMTDKSLYDFDDEESEEDDEEMIPKQKVEADDLSEFLLAIDAEGVQKKGKGKKKVAVNEEGDPTVGTTDNGDGDGGATHELLNEDEIFQALKI